MALDAGTTPPNRAEVKPAGADPHAVFKALEGLADRVPDRAVRKPDDHGPPGVVLHPRARHRDPLPTKFPNHHLTHVAPEAEKRLADRRQGRALSQPDESLVQQNEGRRGIVESMAEQFGRGFHSLACEDMRVGRCRRVAKC